MDLQTVLQICEIENIEKLDELKDELYLHLPDIFHLIIEKEKVKLYHYLVKYLKNHFVNQITKGDLYKEYLPYIQEFGLYLLLQKQAPDNEIYSYLDSNFRARYFRGFFETEAIVKIFNLDLPERLINILKNVYMTIVLDGYNEDNDDNYRHRLNIYCESYTTQDFWADMFDHPFTKHYWDLVMKMPDPDKLLEILKSQPELNSLLSTGNIEFFNKILKPATQVNLYHYYKSCQLGDFDFSFKLLNRILETNFESPEELLQDRIAKGRIRCCQLRYFADSLIHSNRSGNRKLVEFNTTIIKKLFKKTNLEIEKYVRDDKMKHDIDFFLQNSIDTYDKLYTYHFCEEHPLIFDNLKKLLIHFEENDKRGEIKISPNVDIFLAFYHLMNTGYRRYFSRVTFVGLHHDNTIMTQEISAYLRKIQQHFNDKNAVIKKEIKKLNILFPVLLNVVYDYASY